MSVQECLSLAEADAKGFRWEDAGHCFTGPDGRARAAGVGAAMVAVDEDPSPELQKAAEAFISSLSTFELMKVLVPDNSIVPIYKTVEYPRCQVKKTNEELRLVYSEVYAPTTPDTQGDFMTAETIRVMAHNFLADALTDQVDVSHDNDCTRDCFVVESFIARKDDPDFLEDAWVVAVHVLDDELWQAVKDGKINGFSMQANVRVREKILEIDIPDDGVLRGVTDTPTGALEGEPGHTHTYTLRFSDVGDLLGGETNTTAGHTHQIRAATVTEPPRNEPTGHVHRFSFLEDLGRGAVVDGQNRAGASGNDGSF